MGADWMIRDQVEQTNIILRRIEQLLMQIRDELREQPHD